MLSASVTVTVHAQPGGSERHNDAVVVHALGFAARKRGLAVNDKAVRHGFNVCTEVFERRFHGKQTVTLL